MNNLILLLRCHTRCAGGARANFNRLEPASEPVGAAAPTRSRGSSPEDDLRRLSVASVSVQIPHVRQQKRRGLSVAVWIVLFTCSPGHLVLHIFFFLIVPEAHRSCPLRALAAGWSVRCQSWTPPGNSLLQLWVSAAGFSPEERVPFCGRCCEVGGG